MSLLPCNGDLTGLGLLEEGRFWDLDALREHIQACSECACVWDAMAAAFGAAGGAAGRGSAKRRGDSAFYRQLASRRTDR